MQTFVRLLVPALLCAMPGMAMAATADCPDLTIAQKWAGYLFSMHFLKILGVSAVAGGILMMFHGIILAILQSTKYFLEKLGYIASFGLIAAGHGLGAEYQLWPVMTGCLLFAACVFFTIALHELKGDNPTGVFLLITAVWGATAIYYNDTAIGFITIGALMGALGFTFVVTPFSYGFGFRGDNDSVVRNATGAALWVVALAVMQKVSWPMAPAYVQVFAPGAQWLATFVACLGLLIMSSKWFEDGVYLLMQPTILVITIGLVMVGMIFRMDALANIAGVFLVFYLASKPLEVPNGSVTGVGFAITISGIILSSAWYYMNQVEAAMRTFLGA